MAETKQALRLLSERGHHLGADELIERVEAELAGDSLALKAGAAGTPGIAPAERRGNRRRAGGVRLALAAFAGVLVLGGVSLLIRSPANDVGSPGPTEPVGQAAAAPLSVPDAALSRAPSVTVTDIGTESAPSSEPPELSQDGMTFQYVSDLLGSTGKRFEELPDFVPDAAVRDERVVVVGGNEARTAGIWYSDAGAWIPAQIAYPDGLAIGEGSGEYRLSDGIQNVESTNDGFVAWEPVEFVDDEPIGAGTLLFVSQDGARWTASLIDEQFGDLVVWQDGYLAVVYEPNVYATSKAIWSADLVTWTVLAELGEGEAFEVTQQDGSVVIQLRVFQAETADDGSVNLLGSSESIRSVVLDLTG